MPDRLDDTVHMIMVAVGALRPLRMRFVNPAEFAAGIDVIADELEDQAGVIAVISNELDRSDHHRCAQAGAKAQIAEIEHPDDLAALERTAASGLCVDAFN